MKETLKKVKNNNGGFTLMEMIIVVAIIAILIALIAPNLTGFLDSANDSANKGNAKSCYTAVSAFVVQEKIAGRTLSAGTITITKSAITPATLTLSDTQKNALNDILDRNTLGDGKVVITINAKGNVTQVQWFTNATDASPAATYPESAASS